MDLEPARSSSASDFRQPARHRSGGRLLTVCLLALTGCTGFGQTSPPTTDENVETATVEFVIDGDTVDLIIDGQEERVRLIGIDTPETVSESAPVQCFGLEASEALKGLLPPESEVRIVRDAEARDRFGRLLLYVYRSNDDLFVNQWMVESGFADVLFFEPNTAFERDFTQLRNKARAEQVGLWGQCDGPDQPLE